MEIKHTIEVNTNKEVLWKWLTEFEKIKLWNKTILEEKPISNGEVKNGFKSNVLILEGKKKVWYENEITEYNPFRHLSITLKGGSLGKNPMAVHYTLNEINNKITLNYESYWKPAGLMLHLMLPIIKRMANQNAKTCLQELKTLIENQQG